MIVYVILPLQAAGQAAGPALILKWPDLYEEFGSNLAKRKTFLLITYKLTPQLKGEKCKKKLYILQQHETYVHLKKKKKRERRRKHG